jgi:8-oxo-dGTP pyrophosphatase MutT (NUDIX family)
VTLAGRLAAAFAREPAAPLLAEDDFRCEGEPQPAAVLMAVTDRPMPGLLLTLRQPHLRRHAGQISFPGGRIDPDDSGPVAAALREAAEEVALDPAAATVLGTAAPYRTGSGYHITPVLALIPPDLPLRPQEAEVAALFEVPLAHLLDPANQQEGRREMGGRMRRFFQIDWEQHHIWGITAALIVNLSRQLGPDW